MKVVFQVDVIFPAGGTPDVWFRKEFDLQMQPQLGVPVEHPTWHDPREISGIHLNLEDQSYFVRLAPEKPGNQRERDALIEMYRSHEWTVHP